MAVNEIGLKSLLIMRGWLIFGMGITITDLQMAPSLMDALNIVQIGCARVIHDHKVSN